MSARPIPGGTKAGKTPDPAEAIPTVVIASSGNLAHVYLNTLRGRATGEHIEARYPGLVDGLTRHPGIGAVIVRNADGHQLVHATRGHLDLVTGHCDGVDPLDAFGPHARDAITRLESFETCGDLILLGTIDPVTGEVTGLEELIGSHGGLGGWQVEPFILVPKGLELSGKPLLGAPALYEQLVAWQRQAAAAGAAEPGSEPGVDPASGSPAEPGADDGTLTEPAQAPRAA